MANDWLKSWGWKLRKRGVARIWIHPALSHAIVQTPKGVSYRGEVFTDLESAAKHAMKTHQMAIEPKRKDQ